MGFPEMDNPAYEAVQRKLYPAFKDLKVEILDMFKDEENKKMAFWATAKGDTSQGEYSNEYVFMFQINEAGDKIIKLREYVDSAFMKEFSPKLAAIVGPEFVGKPE